MKLSKKALNCLLFESKKAFVRGEIPVSAVVIDKNGKVVSCAGNSRQKKFSVLGHAEIDAILKAEKKIKDWRLDGYSLVVTLEPCSMCSMIIKESRIDHVYFFINKKDHIIDDFGIDKKIINGYLKEKKIMRSLLTDFFDNKR